MKDIGEEKVQYKNYLKHQVQQKKRKKMATETAKYIYHHQNTFLDLMSLHAKSNDIHQAHILYLPHDKYKKKIYKYALNIVDVASRYKRSYQLTTKISKEVAQAFQLIYTNTL